MEGSTGSGASTPTPDPAATPAATPSDGAPSDEEGPSRYDALMRNRKRLLIALALILLAAAIAVGSTAVFTSSDANAGNLFASGDLGVDAPDAAIFTATNMAPGDTRTGTATVENTGSVSGDFTMSAEVTDNTPGPGGGSLQDVLQVTVAEGGTNVYPPGSFAGMQDVNLGSWDGGESHTYDFTVELPQSAGNEFENASTTVTFTWDAVSN